MTQVGIGIVGTGVGIRTHLNGFRKVSDAEVVGIVGSSSERAAHFAEKHGISKAYSDVASLCADSRVELICVASPTRHHYQDIITAERAAKHILAEKPLGMSLAEVRGLVSRAKRSKKIHVVDHQLRFNPYIQYIRDVLRNDTLGRLYYVRVHQQSAAFSDPNFPWSWSFEAKEGGGVRLAMASHLFDLLQFWFPHRAIQNLTANLDSGISQRKYRDGTVRGVDVSGFFNIHLAIDGGTSASLSATAAAYGPPRFDISIYGERGELQFDLDQKVRMGEQSNRGQLRTVDISGVTPEEQQNKVSIFSGSFVYFAPKLVRAVRAGDPTEIQDATPFSDALMNQSLLEATLQSALTGKSVKLRRGYGSNVRY